MSGHNPYIMPDGSSLSQLLTDHEAHEPQKRSRRKGTAKADRWERSFKMVRNRPPTEAEQSELDYLYKVGRERRRRFLNDKMLRDMAGPLTASEMEGLFKPVPFGDNSHTSPLQEILQPENATILDIFRNIDYDKQSRFIQKWEDRIKHARSDQSGAQQDELRSSAPTEVTPQEAAFIALKKWAGTGRRCRQALKKADPAAVEDLELQYLHFMQQGTAAGELVLELDDSFHRLQAHGLAEFHGLLSHSQASGTDPEKRITIIQWPPGSQHAAAAPVQAGTAPPSVSSNAITCTDILMALEDQPAGGINPSVLKRYLAGHSTESDVASEDYVVL